MRRFRIRSSTVSRRRHRAPRARLPRPQRRRFLVGTRSHRSHCSCRTSLRRTSLPHSWPSRSSLSRFSPPPLAGRSAWRGGMICWCLPPRRLRRVGGASRLGWWGRRRFSGGLLLPVRIVSGMRRYEGGWMKRLRRRAVQVVRWMLPRRNGGSRGECRCWIDLEELFRTIDWNRFPSSMYNNEFHDTCPNKPSTPKRPTTSNS